MAITFFHSGDLGDIIAALPTIRASGGGVLRLGPKADTGQREGFSDRHFKAIAPLLLIQDYIEDVVQGPEQPRDKSFAMFRKTGWNGFPENLADWQARVMGVKITLDPWLKVPPSAYSKGRVIFARSLRYHNASFPWRQIATRDIGRSIFIGFEDEHNNFQNTFGTAIERVETYDLLQVAELIAGAERGYYNASCPLWIAMGLGMPVVEEVKADEQNCKIDHPNFTFLSNNAQAINWLRSEGFEEDLIPNENHVTREQAAEAARPKMVRNHNGMMVWVYPSSQPTPEPKPRPVSHAPTITRFPVPAVAIPATEQRIWHAVFRFDKTPVYREAASWATWDAVYRKNEMMPAHYWNYVRDSARELNDSRVLPYLKDLLKHAMNQAQADDIVCAWLNDDNVMHPDLPRYLRYHVNEFGPCCATRTELLKVIPPLTLSPAEFDKRKLSGHPGRDMWAARKSWFEEIWDIIPDFILGGSMFDSCIALICRRHYGLSVSYGDTRNPAPLHPAEIPRGYLGHLLHPSHWAKPGYEKEAPSQQQNIRLFYEWLAQYGKP